MKKGHEPIKRYFPPIISEALFARVQEGIVKRRWIGGRSGEKVANLFAGYSYCYVCGEKMRVVGTSNDKNVYLKCMSAYKAAGCKEKRFPYLGAERAILRHLADELSLLMAKANVENMIRLQRCKTKWANCKISLRTSSTSTRAQNRTALPNGLLKQLEKLDVSDRQHRQSKAHACWDVRSHRAVQAAQGKQRINRYRDAPQNSGFSCDR